MSRICLVATAALVCLTLTNPSFVSGQEFPNKSIRIVTGLPGAGSDFTTRQIAQGVSGPLGQPVIIDNRPPILVGEIGAKAAPDGYTLVADGGSFWVEPLMRKTPYDPVRDFSPITLTTSSPNLLAVHPAVAANSVKELIALARSKPGALNYATGSTGSSNHLAAELFKSMTRVDIVRISYKGGGPALNDLIAGQVQMMFPTTALAGPHVKSGRLRALAVTSAQPSALFPTLPTVSASGLPGYESSTVYGIFAPAKTPAAIIKRLNQEMVQLLNTRTDLKQRFLDAGLEIVANSPEQFAAVIKNDTTRMAKVIKDAGIKVE